MDNDQHDTIPIRLPSGSKAVVILPRPFTTEDARHFVQFIAAYIEDKVKLSATPAHQEGE